MGDGTETSVWEETGAVVRRAAWDQPLTQPIASSRDAALAELTNIKPATDREFITTLTPCLQLVAPVGMSSDAQDTWFEAARIALDKYPASLLRRGAEHAMKHADHPSKIVPLIVKEIDAAFEQRKRIAAPRAETVALPSPGQEYCTAAEVAEICAKFKVGSYSEHRAVRDPCRPTPVGNVGDAKRVSKAPTREDYIRLFGIDPGEPERPSAGAA